MNKLTYKLGLVIFAAMLFANAGYAKNDSVDTATLTGKVMCGYQGSFTCPGDGAKLGWSGWGKGGKFNTENCAVDLWPDMSEYGKDEKFATPFKQGFFGKAAVFSSMNKNTVLRHFKWMRDYGIDGVFVERLAPEIDTEKELILCNHQWWLATAPRKFQPFDAVKLNFRNTVLENCRQGANQYGRAYAVSYDLSGLKAGQIDSVIEDWKLLVGKMKITKDKAYLRHNGKPVIMVCGIGFKDNHEYTLDECAKLVDFLKNDSNYGGCTVALGVPSCWRALYNDCVDDKKIREIALAADIICPWTVGRFDKPDDVPGFGRNVWGKDIKWCKKNNKEYMPVVWPGFSWHNTFEARKLNQFKRLKGRLLWKQFVETKKAGATMLFLASFDNLNEGTAILKCTNTPPGAKGSFLTNDGLPSNYYLWLTGQGGKMLRGETELAEELPKK
jgi:hypothetical protein